MPVPPHLVDMQYLDSPPLDVMDRLGCLATANTTSRCFGSDEDERDAWRRNVQLARTQQDDIIAHGTSHVFPSSPNHNPLPFCSNSFQPCRPNVCPLFVLRFQPISAGPTVQDLMHSYRNANSSRNGLVLNERTKVLRRFVEPSNAQILYPPVGSPEAMLSVPPVTGPYRRSDCCSPTQSSLAQSGQGSSPAGRIECNP